MPWPPAGSRASGARARLQSPGGDPARNMACIWRFPVILPVFSSFSPQLARRGLENPRLSGLEYTGFRSAASRAASLEAIRPRQNFVCPSSLGRRPHCRALEPRPDCPWCALSLQRGHREPASPKIWPLTVNLSPPALARCLWTCVGSGGLRVFTRSAACQVSAARPWSNRWRTGKTVDPSSGFSSTPSNSAGGSLPASSAVLSAMTIRNV